MVETKRLVPWNIVTSLHMKLPSSHCVQISRYKFSGCVNTHSVRSEMARLMMKMLRGGAHVGVPGHHEAHHAVAQHAYGDEESEGEDEQRLCGGIEGAFVTHLLQQRVHPRVVLAHGSRLGRGLGTPRPGLHPPPQPLPSPSTPPHPAAVVVALDAEVERGGRGVTLV